MWPVCTAWLVANAPWLFGFRLVNQVATEEASAVPLLDDKPGDQARPPFAKLVHPSAWGALRYLKAELQYIRVVTDRGQSLILYSLRDAIAELPPESGVQIHRSFWVAWEAVKRFHVRGRQGEVDLGNGIHLPVSRGNVKRLKELMEKRQRDTQYFESGIDVTGSQIKRGVKILR